MDGRRDGVRIFPGRLVQIRVNFAIPVCGLSVMRMRPETSVPMSVPHPSDRGQRRVQVPAAATLVRSAVCLGRYQPWISNEPKPSSASTVMASIFIPSR